MSAGETTQAREAVKPENIKDHCSNNFSYGIWGILQLPMLQITYTVDSEQQYVSFCEALCIANFNFEGASQIHISVLFEGCKITGF